MISTRGRHGGHKKVQLPAGAGKDFRPGGFPVGFGVGGVDKLPQDKAVGDLRRQLLRLVDGPLQQNYCGPPA